MTLEKSAQMHAAKARQRMNGPAPDYPPEIDYDAPVESWRIRRFVTGKIYDIVLFPESSQKESSPCVTKTKSQSIIRK